MSLRLHAQCVGYLLLVALVALWPLALFGYPTNADDTFWHFIYSEGFFHDLAAGQIYPRWIAEANGGLGAATFYFYYPVAYWITSAMAVLTGARDGLAMLAVTAPVLLFASGVTAFIWLRSLVLVTPALVGAALYMVAPYHLIIDVWMRGAYAEAAAYIWVPLLFRAVEDARNGSYRKSAFALPISLTLLAMTHVIVTVLALPVMGIYALLRVRERSAWIILIAGGIAGLMMAGVYLIPMQDLQSLVTLPSIPLEAGQFMFGPRAHAPLPADASPGTIFSSRPLRLFLDLLLVSELLLLIALWLSSRRLKSVGKDAMIWMSITAVLLLSTTVIFASIGRVIPIYNQFQFPSRVNSIADLALITSIALVIQGMSLSQLTCRRLLMSVMVFGSAVVIVPIAAGKFNEAARDWNAIRSVRDVRDAFRPIEAAGKLSFDKDPAAMPNLPPAMASQGSVTIRSWEPGEIVLAANLPDPAMIDVSQLYMPLWKADSDTGQTMTVSPSKIGTIQIRAPAGQHLITLKLVKSVAEVIGFGISLLGLLLWIMLIIVYHNSYLRSK
jgi:hypothetical protein